jgi:hypothetical protein
MAFEIKVLKRMFQSKVQKTVTERWRKLKNEELHNTHCSRIKTREIKSRMVGTCSTNNRKIRTQFYFETVKGMNHLVNLVLNGK